MLPDADPWMFDLKTPRLVARDGFCLRMGYSTSMIEANLMGKIMINRGISGFQVLRRPQMQQMYCSTLCPRFFLLVPACRIGIERLPVPCNRVMVYFLKPHISEPLLQTNHSHHNHHNIQRFDSAKAPSWCAKEHRSLACSVLTHSFRA